MACRAAELKENSPPGDLDVSTWRKDRTYQASSSAAAKPGRGCDGGQAQPVEIELWPAPFASRCQPARPPGTGAPQAPGPRSP